MHSADEPLLLAGVGTYALEIFEELPDPDVVLVPIGGGSGACGLVTVRNALASGTRIVGVQATGADAFARSWRTGHRVTSDRVDTFAEGIATRVTFDLPWSILAARSDGARGLDEIVTLPDAALEHAMRLALETTQTIGEGAGVAAIAAASELRAQLAGKKVVAVMSGGNVATETLARVLSGHAGLSRPVGVSHP